MAIKKGSLFILAVGTLIVLAMLAGCAQSTPSSTSSPKPPPATTSSAPPATSSPISTSTSPAATTKPAGGVITLRFATQWPEPSPTYQILHKAILDEIQQKSNGRIKFEVFSGSALGPPEQMYDGARTGKVDIANASPAYTPGRFLMSEVISLPGAYGFTKQANENMVLAVGDRILSKEYVGVVPLAYWQSQPFLLYTANKPVKTMEDLKGLKIRQPGGILAQAIQALGATPINMVMGDMYVALQTGVLDGAAIGPSGIMSFKLGEVLKYVTRYNMGYAIQLFVANPDTWKTIPPDLQTIIKDAFRTAGKYEITMFDTDDKVLNDILAKRGGSSYTLTAEEEAKWTNAFKPMVQTWQTDMKSKGQPIDELMTTVREECKNQGINFPY